MKITLTSALFFALFAMLMTGKSVYAQNLLRITPVEAGDTLLVGVVQAENYSKVYALLVRYNKMLDNRSLDEMKQNSKKVDEDFSENALADALKKNENERVKALKTLAGLPDGSDKQKMIAEINRIYDELKKTLPAKFNEMKQMSGDTSKKIADMPGGSYSVDSLYILKGAIASLCADGRLHNYDKSREFRHGLAAVSRKVDGKRVWGFIDGRACEIIPCIYDDVFDFNNRKYYRSNGAFEVLKDADTRPWTTVWKNGKAGVIDNKGNVVIPFEFKAGSGGYSGVFFKQTPWGEFAPVRDYKSGKAGIINREGKYTVPPRFEYIEWDDTSESFVADFDRLPIDAYGNELKK